MFKSETQQTIKVFSTEVEHPLNTSILTIRSDNGTEFKNYSLNEFLSDAGIKHQYSAAYTP
jgi:transposase InsO family protein